MLKKSMIAMLMTGCFFVPASWATTDMNVLFTQIGTQVTITPCQSKAMCDYTIALKGLTQDKVTWFSDRPQHVTGEMTIEKFVASWAKGGDSFAKELPNASFVYFDANDHITQNIVRLSHPMFDQATNTLRYEIKEIGRAKIQAGTYQHPVLFIDSHGFNMNW